jgi:hypothetical protein
MDKKYEEDLENFCDHGDIGDDWLVILSWTIVQENFISHLDLIRLSGVVKMYFKPF